MCVFCEIIAGRSKAEVVLDEQKLIAFLDVRPVFQGHVLVAPRAHHETLMDLPDALLQPIFGATKRIAAALERGLGAEGSWIAINNRVSQTVPHLHVHVVPRKKGDGLKGFFWPRVKYGEGEMENVGAKIRKALAGP
jgi:histidine triad (HIT) family protein